MPHESAIDPAGGTMWIRPDGVVGMRQGLRMPAPSREQQSDIPIQDRETAGTPGRDATGCPEDTGGSAKSLQSGEVIRHEAGATNAQTPHVAIGSQRFPGKCQRLERRSRDGLRDGIIQQLCTFSKHGFRP